MRILCLQLEDTICKGIDERFLPFCAHKRLMVGMRVSVADIVLRGLRSKGDLRAFLVIRVDFFHAVIRNGQRNTSYSVHQKGNAVEVDRRITDDRYSVQEI